MGKLTVDKVLQDRTWRVLCMQYAKKRYVTENINFLIAAVVERKLDKKTFDEFLRKGANQEVNIAPHGLGQGKALL